MIIGVVYRVTGRLVPCRCHSGCYQLANGERRMLNSLDSTASFCDCQGYFKKEPSRFLRTLSLCLLWETWNPPDLGCLSVCLLIGLRWRVTSPHWSCRTAVRSSWAPLETEVPRRRLSWIGHVALASWHRWSWFTPTVLDADQGSSSSRRLTRVMGEDAVLHHLL